MWSLPVDVGFTVVLAVTGGYSLLRWAGLRATSGDGGDQLTELAHLLMSLAMIAMTWRPSGATETIVQVAVFGAFAGHFATHIRPGRRWVLATYHLLMCAAMAWMALTMPMLMSGNAQESMPGMDMPGMRMGSGADSLIPGPAPRWIVAATAGFAVLMVASAGMWLRRLILCETPAAQAKQAVDQHQDGCGVTARSATSPAALFPLFGQRAAACCHLLMSAAMAVMLLLTV